MNFKTVNITRDEGRATVMALETMIEDMKATTNDPAYPWSPEARKTSKEIIEAATSAKNKLKKIFNITGDLPGYTPGDENEFFTKES